MVNHDVVFFKSNFIENIEKSLKILKIDKVLTKGDKVAVKVHMGEYGNLNYVRPPIIGRVVEILNNMETKPFLFDTPTLYHGSRYTVKDYLETARKNGFTEETIGCPIIISETYVEVDTKGCLKKVKVAKHLYESEAIFVISHGKGHVSAGFGGAIKNLGMGGVTKEVKKLIHTLSQPVLIDGCEGCGNCVRVCKNKAIILKNKKPNFNYGLCYGCGACISVCPNNALIPKVENLRILLAEGAFAVLKNFGKKQFFMNILMDITEYCDCSNNPGFPVVDDIGILVSKDPVAIDTASIDLIEKKACENFFLKLHNVDPREILDAGVKFGLGSKMYRIKVL